MRVHIMSICLLMGVAALQSCKTASKSATKDIGGSPADVSNASLPMTFVKIPAGTFMMGSPDNESGRELDEGPQHQVTISKAFEMQTTEVTQSLWVSVMGYNPSYFQKSENCPDEFTTINNIPMCPNNPVETVSYGKAEAFISMLEAKADGYRYRLPTEAEWEYAARAGTTGAYAGDLDAMAWYQKNSRGMSHPVGTKQANAWGLFDMHGNVNEWTTDARDYYSAAQVTDPVGASSGYRVHRGGSFLRQALDCRSADRYNTSRGDFGGPYDRSGNLGFRLLRTSP